MVETTTALQHSQGLELSQCFAGIPANDRLLATQSKVAMLSARILYTSALQCMLCLDRFVRRPAGAAPAPQLPN